MKSLRPPFDIIAEDLEKTFKYAHEHHNKDYQYYPIAMAIENVLQKYTLVLRPKPLERSEILEPVLPCLVCNQPITDTVFESYVYVGKNKARMHPTCVKTKAEREKETK